ncbi:MAG: hypothetical protein MUE51_12835 [Thermoleophilia bacterium]|nr:hypothetical protein [Thermoleophilia bacterium]
MDVIGRRRAAAGQATVEHIGLVVAVALLMGALALWGVREMRPPEHPPDVVGAAARPLAGAARPARDAAVLSWMLRAEHVGAGAGRTPVERAVRFLVAGRLIAAEGEVDFIRAFAARVRERAGEALADPGGIARDLADPDLDFSDPRRVVTERWDDLLRYLGELRSLPAREAFLRASRDAGGLAADVAIARVVRAARRAVTERVTRRPPSPPAPAPRRAGRRRATPPPPPPPATPARPRAKPGEAASPAGTPRAPRRG